MQDLEFFSLCLSTLLQHSPTAYHLCKLLIPHVIKHTILFVLKTLEDDAAIHSYIGFEDYPSLLAFKFLGQAALHLKY